MFEERLKRHLDFMLPDEVTRRRHGYRKPTIEASRVYRAELAERYRLFDERTSDEQERALHALVPAKRRKQRILSSEE